MKNLMIISLLALSSLLSAQEKREVKTAKHCTIVKQWMDTASSIVNVYTSFSVKEDTAYPVYVLKVSKRIDNERYRDHGRILIVSLEPEKQRSMNVYFFFCNSLFPNSPQGGGTITRESDGDIISYDNRNTAFSFKEENGYFLPIRKVHENSLDIMIDNYMFDKPKVQKK